MRAVPLLLLLVAVCAGIQWPWTKPVKPTSGASVVRGQIAWQAFGVWNFTSNINRWDSYSLGSPVNNAGVNAIRSTSATITPGEYVMDYQLSVAATCPSYNTPCVSTINQTLCPHLAVYISCVDASAGQSMIQGNMCPVGQVPPNNFLTCVGPPADHSNLLVAHRYYRLNTAGATSASVTLNTAGLGSPQYIDFSSMSQGNCSLVLAMADSCNSKFPYPMDYFSTLYFNLYSVVAQ